MKIPKRIIAFFMAIVIGISGFIYALGYEAYADTDIPVIVISGDSDPIYDSEGNIAFSTRAFGEMISHFTREGESLTDALTRLVKEASAEYVKGFLKQDFTDYYQLFYDSVEPIFKEARLDCNGDNTNGSYINHTFDPNNIPTYLPYSTGTYRFYYDWRLDPLESADKLNEYIKAVEKATGHDKVGVICRCLGANIFLAYVSKYGTDDIYGAGFDGIIANGAEFLSEPISGGFTVDVGAIDRLLIDLDSVDKADIDPKITAALDTVSKSGIVDIIKFFVNLYAFPRVEKGLISSIALASVYTWPNYWAAVSADDYENAKEYVFGPEGSELREEYAGLIEKLDNYDVQVRQRIPELMQEINDNANLIIISKYGFQMVPVAESRDKVADQFVSVTSSSFGATTGTIFEPLSDEYIAQRVSEGKADYISPDLEIDASTCLFPDQTFFIKGASHSDWTQPEMSLLAKVICSDHQLTVKDLPDYQFMVYDYDTDTSSPMDSENCNTEAWVADPSERSYNPFLKLASLFRSVKALAAVLQDDEAETDETAETDEVTEAEEADDASEAVGTPEAAAAAG